MLRHILATNSLFLLATIIMAFVISFLVFFARFWPARSFVERWLEQRQRTRAYLWALDQAKRQRYDSLMSFSIRRGKRLLHRQRPVPQPRRFGR